MEVFLSPPFYRWEHWRLNLIFFSSGSPCPDSSLPSSFSHLAHTANSAPTPRSALTVPPTGQHNYVHNGRQPHDGWLSSGLSDALKLFVSCWVRDSMCVWKISVWTIWQYLVSRRLYQPPVLTDSWQIHRHCGKKQVLISCYLPGRFWDHCFYISELESCQVSVLYSWGHQA